VYAKFAEFTFYVVGEKSPKMHRVVLRGIMMPAKG